MTDQFIQVPPTTGTSQTGLKVDTSELTVGANTVERQRIVIADPTQAANFVTVSTNGTLAVQGYQPASASQNATGTGTLASVSVTEFNIVTITLRTFTGTTPSVTWGLQASDDNTNWVTIQGVNNASGLVGTSWTQGSALTAGTAGISVDYTIGAYTNVRIDVTAISGAAASATFGIDLQTMSYESTPGAICQGIAPAGSPPQGSPVLIAGSDATDVRTILTDSTGVVQSNISKWAGTALGTPTNFGTTPTAVAAATVNASLFVGTVVLTTSAAGVLKVGISGASGGTVDGTIAGASPASVIWIEQAPSTVAAAAMAAPVGVTLAATSAVVTSTTGHNLYGMSILNTSTAALVIQFFNTTTTTTLSTATFIGAFAVPSTSGGGVLSIPPGAMALAQFSSGICVLVATNMTSTSTAAGSTLQATILYK